MVEYFKCEDVRHALCVEFGFTSKRAAIAVDCILNRIPKFTLKDITNEETGRELKEREARGTK